MMLQIHSRFITKGSFTLATFVCKTAGDRNWQRNLTLLALATLGSVTQIGSFLLAKVS